MEEYTSRVSGAMHTRARGIPIGGMATGRWNALTDVPGVRVGHCTVAFGDGALVPGHGPARTGVTAIQPHRGNIFREKAPAASHVINGFAKSIGLVQVDELGVIETPILLTNTLNVPRVADALIDHMLAVEPDIGIGTTSVNPVTYLARGGGLLTTLDTDGEVVNSGRSSRKPSSNPPVYEVPTSPIRLRHQYHSRY